MELVRLIEVLKRVWDAESSFSKDEWSKDNPAQGQCAVSSLIVQDYLGGDIIRFVVEFDGRQEKHYANLVNGALIDVTRSQFPEDVIMRVSDPDLDDYKNLREQILSVADTARRYYYLKNRVKADFENKSANDR